ncbi:conserved hypothetical protein [Lodderomyces elongisporus NRRL YB-4239]|uniref:Chromatin modification-related protein EAF3 n=1 Tax=Lodderomyces elongisporus (strain ATCC 11503 / CBS 2605 / JCM 1781 / NBRC 1676 / NRRL YB-4239) TaxID=379508 RepID=A5DZ22_LODEL|nr:conserved hypothetical protein [Lodderomyces elongisporus NRRL YB-4239]
MVSYSPNQIVYAYHGPLIYEAKIIKTKQATESFVLNNDNQQETFEQQGAKFDAAKWDGLNCFLLHYQGWNAKWDEWVGEERVLEINEENKFKKLELEQLTKKKKVKKEESTKSSGNGKGGSKSGSKSRGEGGSRSGNGNGNSSSSSSSSNGGGGNASKRQRTSGSGSSNASSNSSNGGGGGGGELRRKTSNINLKFPPELKYVLVNDWQYITKDKKLVKLPSNNYSVHTILQDYRNLRKEVLDKHQLGILLEILHGLEIYFNKSLSLLLLYKHENLQYLDFLKRNVISYSQYQPGDAEGSSSRSHCQSKVYGFEHLLRLLVLFPSLISQTTMDSLSISVLVLELEHLLVFLKDNMGKYQNEYEYQSPQYNSLATS